MENAQFLMFKEQVRIVGKHDEFSNFGCSNNIIYKKNEKSGPKLEPWGTPYATGKV